MDNRYILFFQVFITELNFILKLYQRTNVNNNNKFFTIPFVNTISEKFKPIGILPIGLNFSIG